jgi:hypothetical protein
LGDETVPCSIIAMSDTGTSDYRLAPAFVARLLGLALVGLALLLFAGTAVVAITGLPPHLLVGIVLLGVVATATLGWWLHSRAWVVRCTDEGYQVRLIRGVGVARARWSSVEGAVTVHRRDLACLELRLRDGGTTTIPVEVLAVDKDDFVRELQQRLQRGHGLRPL